MNRRDAIAATSVLPIALASRTEETEAGVISYKGEKFKIVQFRHERHIANLEDLFRGVPWVQDRWPPVSFIVPPGREAKSYEAQEVRVWIPEDRAIRYENRPGLVFFGVSVLSRYRGVGTASHGSPLLYWVEESLMKSVNDNEFLFPWLATESGYIQE